MKIGFQSKIINRMENSVDPDETAHSGVKIVAYYQSWNLKILSKNYHYLTYFSIKTYVMGTH